MQNSAATADASAIVVAFAVEIDLPAVDENDAIVAEAAGVAVVDGTGSHLRSFVVRSV